MRVAKTIELDVQTERELRVLSQRKRIEVRLQQRARIVLLAAKGMQPVCVSVIDDPPIAVHVVNDRAMALRPPRLAGAVGEAQPGVLLPRVEHRNGTPEQPLNRRAGGVRESPLVEAGRRAGAVAEDCGAARDRNCENTAAACGFGHVAMLHSPLGDTGEIPNCTGARAHPPLRDATDRSLALAEVVLPGMIALDEITKSYNGRPALRGVTIRVDRGEFVYLTGPSGAGKSTFLRLLYRAELPDSGAIQVNGADLTTMRRREVAEFRRRLGVVFQDFKLLRRRTVAENVTFVLSLLNFPDREQQRRAYLVLKQMGLQNRMNAYPEELSGGEQQRVAIARALVLQPDLILADEPSGNLDPERSHELLELLKTINYQGTTVVVATHDRTLIEAHPARTLFLDHGRVVRDAWVTAP